jgi:hypothetical protein
VTTRSASSILQESVILAADLESVLRGSPGLETIATEAREAVVGDKESIPQQEILNHASRLQRLDFDISGCNIASSEDGERQQAPQRVWLEHVRLNTHCLVPHLELNAIRGTFRDPC